MSKKNKNKAVPVADTKAVEAVVEPLVVDTTPVAVEALPAAPEADTTAPQEHTVEVSAEDSVSLSEIEMIEAIALAAAPDVGTNGLAIDWPSDPYGLTKDLKTAIKQVASRIAGHADKKALVSATLIKAIAHLKVKFEADAAIRDARLAEAAAQESNQEAE